MRKLFRGAEETGPCFEGWYFKHQTSQGRTLALIPAFHIDSAGRRSASLQVIAEDRAWWLDCPAEDLRISRWPLQIQIGPCRFSAQGMDLQIRQEGLSLCGALRYGPFTGLESDIMGPFRFFGGMQCAHGVVSMGHALTGTLSLNGEDLDFSGGRGYLETDRGRSFPSAYLWTQCAWGEPGQRGLMLAIAAIPLPVGGFTGCICAVRHGGREYRLATYRGARIVRWSPAGAVIRQGRYRLEAEVLRERRQPLRAPVEGRMERTIHESLCAEMCFRFWRGEELLFQHTDPHASFEYSAEQKPPG